MRPLDRQAPATSPESSGENLVWPIPVADSDILWLEHDGDPAPKLDAAPLPASSVALPLSAPPVAPSPSGKGIALTRLLANDVAVEWHDAVAVVCQLADDVLPDARRPPAGALPGIEAIQLESNGRIQARVDPRGSEPFTTGVGRVLQALLQDKPTPANLRLLAWRATSGTSESLTLAEIIGELARWERPGRIEKLKSLYERARAAGPAAPVVSPPAPAPVPEQIVKPATVPIPAPPPAASAGQRSRHRIGLIAGAAAVVIAAGGAGAWLLARRPPVAVAPAATAAAATDADSKAAVEPATTRRGTRRSGRGTAQPKAAQDRPPRSDSSRTAVGVTRPRTPRDAAAAPSASTIPGLADRPPTSPAPADSIAKQSAVLGVSALPAVPDTRLYKSGDAGVTEAILVKPYLPTRDADVPESALGVLEVVVNARGLVESVHLKSPANRYREKWWLFTAKDWRFEPARKNGTPVRFLKRILLTDLNISEPQ